MVLCLIWIAIVLLAYSLEHFITLDFAPMHILSIHRILTSTLLFIFKFVKTIIPNSNYTPFDLE